MPSEHTGRARQDGPWWGPWAVPQPSCLPTCQAGHLRLCSHDQGLDRRPGWQREAPSGLS